MRLVQRKFAQGVPLPPSINVAPAAPERKAEPPRDDQRTVYHNGMSARSLLDIVALQNVCRHKQPMVLLERLREDEIPVPVPPAPVLPVKKKRLAQKPKKKNMQLRPRETPKPTNLRKRKLLAATKGPSKKRPCASRDDKLAEDDMPLLYLSSGSKEPPPEKKTDHSFTFKSPSSVTVVKRKFKRTVRRRISSISSGSSWSGASRVFLTPVPFNKIVRRSTRLAGTLPPPASGTRASRGFPVRPGSVKPKRKIHAPARTESTDQPEPITAVSKSTETAATECSSPSTSPVPATPRTIRVPRNSSVKPKKKIVTTAVIEYTAQRQAVPEEQTTTKLEPAETTILERSTESPKPTENIVTGILDDDNSSGSVRADYAIQPLPDDQSSTNTQPPVTKSKEPAVAAASIPIVKIDDDDSSGVIRLRFDDSDSDLESARAVDPECCPSKNYSSVQDVMVAANARCRALAARCRRCRGCGIVGKVIQLTRLVCSEMSTTAGDVYDFNAEIVEAISPSLSCLRNQSRLARAVEEEKHLFMDLLPDHSPHIIQITLKRTAESQFISKACIVDRDVMTTIPQPSLIVHENLLDRLLECLSAASQREKEEPQPSTSRQPDPAGAPDARPALRPCTVDLGKQLSQAKEGCRIASLTAGPNAADEDFPDSSSDVDRPRDTANSGKVLEAPIFYPTDEEFRDPIAYYEQIAPIASKFGLCKIVAPTGFTPPCVMDENMRFAVIYQYISKLYSRWGPASRELAAIKAHMKTQSVPIARSPLLDGSEVNLPKLHHSVQRNGGPTSVIQRKRWGRVAEEMKLTKLQNPERKLDQLFMRYLLPYTMLSNQERQKKMAEVEKCWTVKYQKMLERARNPFHRQKRMLGESESSEDEAEDNGTAEALHEAEDCIVQGRIMHLATFRKIATSLMEAHLEGGAPTAAAAEAAYWRAVLHGTEHIVANTASIDTGEEGYGFPKDPNSVYGDHPWNLKRLSQNPGNVLRFLGPVLGVTVPTLHLGMLFSTSCWHRDPHGLPWTEFMHSGPEKIWYGIPSAQSANFRRAVETLCPAYCQSKSIWLASDIAMIPPDILSEHNVTLSRATQQPGEYIMVFPEAHSCSITTGFAISESVYFASRSWLDNVHQLFQELRNSCEPTMFSLEQLLMSGGRDRAAPRYVLPGVLGALLREELAQRRALAQRGLQVQIYETKDGFQPQAWSARNQDECEFCRSTLFFSKVIGLPGKKSLLCPEHALRLLDSQKYSGVNAKALAFVSRFSSDTLRGLWTVPQLDLTHDED